jgi:hypothetical protein
MDSNTFMACVWIVWSIICYCTGNKDMGHVGLICSSVWAAA